MSTTQQTGFVDPSSLSLPSSSSLKRSVSPSSSRDDSPDPQTFAEPPRKRPRSAVTPEERKEARAHRNRIAAQNSRDRRKAQFSFLERRVTELEEENRRLRAGIPASPASTSVSEPEVIVVETEEARKQTRDNEQRERENEELRERIRTLEKGYEAVVRALAAQAPIGAATVPSPAGIPTPPASSSPAPPTTSTSPSSTSTGSSSTPSPAPLAQSSYPLSPAPTNATLANSPALFANDSFDFPQSPEFSLDSIVDLAAVSDITVPSSSIDLSLNHGHAPTRHLAAGGRRTAGDEPDVSGQEVCSSEPINPEDEAATDAAITRLFAEILASPPAGTCALPSVGASSEDTRTEVLSETKSEETPDFGSGLGLGISLEMNTVDWAEQVRAELEMERLLGMLPDVQAPSADVDMGVNLDVDMDFSTAFDLNAGWDGVAVF